MATASEGDPGKKAVSTILLTETRKATEVLNGIVHATVVHTNEGDDFSKEESTLKGSLFTNQNQIILSGIHHFILTRSEFTVK